MDIVLAIFALGLLIVIHEFGHYLAAVKTGMKVDRFSVFGIGPAIVRLGHYKGTEYVIGAIPFGAYVLIRGMEAEDEGEQRAGPPPPDSPNFRDKPLWARFLVLAGGPLANYLAAIVILFGVFTVAGVKGPIEAAEVERFAEVSAARDGGIQVGDELLAIGDHEIDPSKASTEVASASEQYLGKTVDIVVQRGGERVTVPVTLPDEPPGLGLWFTLRATRQPVGVGEAAVLSVRQPVEITARQLEGLYKLVTGQLKADIEGPVGIVRHIARSAESGVIAFLSMSAFISTLLGMFNLLPLPALDGGRMTFLVYEALARKPANRRVEEMVHGIGMLALLALIALVTIGDIRGS